MSWTDLLGRAGEVGPEVTAARAAAVGPDDVGTVIFTSGTTGAPKGAMLRHGAAVRAYTAWTDIVGLREGDRYLIVNPFFHCFGLLAGVLACLVRGSTIVPHPVFDVPSVMRRVDEEGITMLPGPPPSTRRSSTTPSCRRSTCRRCAWPSPGRRPCRWR